MTPSVSVIVPIYNVGGFLEQCLKSLQDQVLDSFEVIMINDGSTDNGPQIASEISQADSRFSLYHKTNGGLGSARNEGMKYAKGEYIKHVDSDDWFDKGMLDGLFRRAKRFDADIVIGTYFEAMKNDTEVRLVHLPPSLANSTEAFSWRENRDVFATPTPIWDKLYRRSLIEENGISFIKENCEDIPYRWQTLLASKRITTLSSPYYYYRVREGSLSGGRTLGLEVEHALRVAESHLIKAGLRSELDEEWSLRKVLETVYIPIKARKSLIQDRDFARQFLPRLQQVCRNIDLRNLGPRHSWIPANFMSVYLFGREIMDHVSFRSFLQEQQLLHESEGADDYALRSSLSLARPGRVKFSIDRYPGESWDAGTVRGTDLVLGSPVYADHREPCVASIEFDVQAEISALYGTVFTEQEERNCDVSVNVAVETLQGQLVAFVRRVVPVNMRYEQLKLNIPRGRYVLKAWVEGDPSVPARHFTAVAIKDLTILKVEH
ncbi:glycosyltransferase (plasmid) [Ensifer sp. PDNC004]|uniref:glycosyltransferase family 2 protein n=1 Tax=Ensifer sp. PDNC004 TaxID=2811423 RepID=UPI00196485A1|nr:glycosyltransferase [Ensifer sp. PDNC004]QRY65487.1 glycosyltransferase [Ensifer sp. PDNC004]